jgi:hypothetical protein
MRDIDEQHGSEEEEDAVDVELTPEESAACDRELHELRLDAQVILDIVMADPRAMARLNLGDLDGVIDLVRSRAIESGGRIRLRGAIRFLEDNRDRRIDDHPLSLSELREFTQPLRAI